MNSAPSQLAVCELHILIIAYITYAVNSGKKQTTSKMVFLLDKIRNGNNVKLDIK